MFEPSVPIDYDELKAAVRVGLSKESRFYWWPILSSLPEGNRIEMYPNVALTASNLLSLCGVKYELVSHLDVVELIMRTKQLEDSSIVEDLIVILSSIIPKYDIIFLVLTDMFSREEKFLCTTSNGVQRRTYTFKVLLSHFMPKTYQVLESLGALEDKYLNLIFVGFFRSILSQKIVLQIMDSFLLEGVKILYRYGLAFIKLYKSSIKSHMFSNANEFWDHTSASSISEEDTTLLYLYAFDSNRSTIDKIRRPMKVGRNQLKQLNEKADKVLPPQTVPIQLYTSTKTSKVSFKAEPTTPLVKKKTFDQDLELFVKVSSILSFANAKKLYSYLDETVKLHPFNIAYSTTVHGYNLDTLYDCTFGRKPSIILIRTLTSPVIVGAYISDYISPSSLHVRGNGTTFCFRLDEDNRNSMKYSWIGLKEHDYHLYNDSFDEYPQINRSGKVEKSNSHEFDNAASSAVEAAKNQFAVFTGSYFAFGGSSTHGSNAIRVDGDLQSCTCGFSDTFNNPPMLFDGEAFQIETLEVLCGK